MQAAGAAVAQQHVGGVAAEKAAEAGKLPPSSSERNKENSA
jgi:hypothetical protein